MKSDSQLWQGVVPGSRGVSYRTWAPPHQTVEAGIVDPLGRAGDLYQYRLDGLGRFPDMASRFQPRGVHGPSEVIDHTRYQWRDSPWQKPPLRELVLYELHIGSFTREGTFRAAQSRLSYLVDLGINAIEIMPLADFAGDRNWGYDGVMPYAPARCYGSPDDLKALVDAAYWLEQFHIDGLRLNSARSIVDDSPRHFLLDLTVWRAFPPPQTGAGILFHPSGSHPAATPLLGTQCQKCHYLSLVCIPLKIPCWTEWPW